jgi:hypothetical protein
VLDEIEMDGSIDHEDVSVAEEQSEQSEDEGPDMLLDFNNFAEAQESDYDSHSESDYSTSESEDSGIDF